MNGQVLTIISGIVVGAVGMFQPWLFRAYTLGFLLLLFSTLAFIVWSHVRPAPPPLEQAAARPIGDEGVTG